MPANFEKEVFLERFGGADNMDDLQWRPRPNLKPVRPPEMIADQLGGRLARSHILSDLIAPWQNWVAHR